MASGCASASCWMAACRALREAASLEQEGSGERHVTSAETGLLKPSPALPGEKLMVLHSRGSWVMEMNQIKTPHPSKSTG